jgi:hypothetical protein
MIAFEFNTGLTPSVIAVCAVCADEKTDNPLYADDRSFYKVEKWTKNGSKIERLLYAGNNLEKARSAEARSNSA